MIRGLYAAATGMAVQREKMDIVTNNIVNAETTGFKADTLVTQTFEEIMRQRVGDPNVTLLGNGNFEGAYSYGTHMTEKVTDFSTGAFEYTGLSTDVAIEGNGFFVVETEAGERYTRAGNFTVDSNGFLTTHEGQYILGQNGRLRVGGGDFTVTADGTVSGSAGVAGRLRLVTVDDTAALRKEGGNLYYVLGGAAAAPDAGSRVLQGVQESSNVNVTDEMVEMISLYRKYEASQKAVVLNDETLGMAVNKLGSI